MHIQTNLQGPQIDAYILPNFDEHLNVEVAESDQRLHFLSGFSGIKAIAVITQKAAAIWVEQRYLLQSDAELDCDWKIYHWKNAIKAIPKWLDVGEDFIPSILYLT